jgi:hypothetical protein
MGKARMKPDGHEFDGQEFDFERNAFLGRVIVDFDPGPDLMIGVYNNDEFDATFDVIEE